MGEALWEFMKNLDKCHCRPIGIIDLVVKVRRKLKIAVNLLSIGPSSIDGQVSTLIQLEVSGLPFEANLKGSWKERDWEFGARLNRFINEHGLRAGKKVSVSLPSQIAREEPVLCK